MTKLRRRVIRLALRLHVAGIEAVSLGGTYKETALRLQQQLSALSRGRRRAVSRRTNRLISEAGGLEAASQLVALPPNQRSTSTQTPSDHLAKPSRNLPPTAPRCSVCRARFGFKRSWPSREIAQQVCEQQKDPRLVVYACLAGAGYHLGHLPDTRPANVGHPATPPQRRAPHRVDGPVAPTSTTPLHKEPSITTQVTLANPFLVAIYSASLLLIGCAVGMHWAHTPATALLLGAVGGVLMAAHDLLMGTLFFVLTARWARSMIQRSNRG